MPHHSKEAARLKARLTLLRVVLREIHARKEQFSRSVPPSRAMRKAWDSGLYPQPADFSILVLAGRARGGKARWRRSEISFPNRLAAARARAWRR
jgi:hypothetical protein